MKLRVSNKLFSDLSRARAWSGASITEIARRACRRACHSNVALSGIRDSATTGGVVITVPDDLGPPKLVRGVLSWYLEQYAIPAEPARFETPLREGVDYLVEQTD